MSNQQSRTESPNGAASLITLGLLMAMFLIAIAGSTTTYYQYGPLPAIVVATAGWAGFEAVAAYRGVGRYAR